MEKENILGVIIIFIYIIILLYFIQNKFFYDRKWIIENNNKQYILRNELDNYNDLILKARMLEILIKNIEILIVHINDKYSHDTQTYYWLKYLNEFDVRDISEAKWKENITSYTLNKKHIFLCMQSQQTKEIYSLNTLTYVLLHELAHFCNFDKKGNPIMGHGPEFMYLNTFLIREAVEIGIYNYINYSKNNEEYCGITLNSSILG